jgi:FKBP-type peptidyl-prolyl cis-trans isomerase FklB
MKIKGTAALIVAIALMLGSCGQKAVQNQKIESHIDSMSYAFGIIYYNAVAPDSLDLNPLLVAKAMMDSKDGQPLMDDNIARGFIMTYVNQRETERAAQAAEANKVLYKEYKEQCISFLDKNKERQGVICTPSGLQYEVIKMGTGPKPTLSSTVKVHYVGTLIDGTEFDSSVKRNEPAQFPLQGIIPGWTEALQLMPVGSKFKIYLPDSLAYGSEAGSDLIKPYSTLIFEVELLDIIQ